VTPANVCAHSASAGGRRQRDLHVGEDRDLRVSSTEQPRAERGQAVDGLPRRLREDPTGGLDPQRVIHARAHDIRLH